MERMTAERRAEIKELKEEGWFCDNPNRSDIDEILDELFLELEAAEAERDDWKWEYNNLRNFASTSQDLAAESKVVIRKLVGALNTLVGHEPFDGLEPRKASEAISDTAEARARLLGGE